MNINSKLIISLLFCFVLFYFINKFNIISGILTSGVIAFLSYIIFYKFCGILCENKKITLDELIKEYNVIGITRIILETFQIFAEKIYFISIHYNYFDLFLKGFFFQKDKKKPIMKDNKNKDKILLFEYLINLLDSEKKTDDFQNVVESIWLDKWSFFAHSGYICNILNDIGDLCYKNNIPIISFLISYKDNTISKLCLQEKWRNGENGWENAKLRIDYKVYFSEFQEYIKKIFDYKDVYLKLLNDYKQKTKYGYEN